MKKKLLTGLALGMLMAASTLAAARQDDGGCNPQGSWMSIYEEGIPSWVGSVNGQSSSSGTDELEAPSFIFYPGLPAAVGMTHMRGPWNRTGGNTFDYTMIGYAYGAGGIPSYVTRMNGTKTLSEDCNFMEVTVAINLFPCPGGICPDSFETEAPPNLYFVTHGFRIRQVGEAE